MEIKQGPVHIIYAPGPVFVWERIIKKEERIMVVDRGAVHRSGDIRVVGG